MRFVVFSDIHGNQYAFREFTKYISFEEYDAMIFCGDILGYYYGQDEIVDVLTNINNLYAVRGNHDEFGIRIKAGTLKPDTLWKQYGHSYGKTSETVLNYIKTLETEIELNIDNKKYGIIHGTPENYLEGRLYPMDSISDSLKDKYQKYDVVFCGHTHFRMDKMCGRTRIINVGSLGQQRDGFGCCYAIFDTVKEKLEYKTIRFDISSLEAEIDIYDPDNKKMKEILHRGE